MTSATGFLFPFERFLPSRALTILSLRPGGCDFCEVRPSPGVGGDCRYGAVFQFFCAGHPVLSEGRGLESDGPDSVRAPVLVDSSGRSGGFRVVGVAAAIRNRDRTVRVG